MYDLVVGAALRQSGSSILLDPTLRELYMRGGEVWGDEGCGEGNLTVGVLPRCNQISMVHADGEMSTESMISNTNLLIETCQQIHPVMQQTLTRHLNNSKN